MLPTRAVLKDIAKICAYLATKPTGASQKAFVAALGAKYSDARKLSAIKSWGFIDEDKKGLKVTDRGRSYAKSDANGRASILRTVIRTIPAYMSVLERVSSRAEYSISSTEVAAHWHEHFTEEASDNDKILNEQAVCFFQILSGTNLGTLTLGRRGSVTRFDFNESALKDFIEALETIPEEEKGNEDETKSLPGDAEPQALTSLTPPKLGQAIFIAHGKNKKPLDQLKSILDQFKIPYRVAIDEPNLGRPIGAKVKETMDSCNCAILIFTADEEFRDKKGNEIWRPSQNVVYELGAAGYLYEKRIVIMKEEGVEFPSDFHDIGYISFVKDQLADKAMDILRELIGFKIVKFTT